MPRDEKAPPREESIAPMFAAAVADMEEDTVIAGLPPTTAPFARSPRSNMPIADLTRLAKILMLIGPGGSGKTVIGRYIGGEVLAHGRMDRTVMAALDPANRTLADFFDTVLQPPSSDPAEIMKWSTDVRQFIAKKRLNAVMDFGGGDVSLARTIELVPDLADVMETEGVGLIAAYVLTPRVDDLASLITFEARGFRPRATALILNLARAETPAAFDAVRRQPAYRAALERGAVELWMPKLDQAISLTIERARVQFRQARDGEAPEGRKPAALSPTERARVREFLERIRAEFQPIEGWMPWT